MKKNLKIARSLVRLARDLVAMPSFRHFGSYSVEADGNIVTVYLVLDEDAVKTDALRNARLCWQDVKTTLEKDDNSIEVTSLEDNTKSFSFTVVVHDDEKSASADANVGVRVAEKPQEANGDEGGKQDDASEEPQDDDGDLLSGIQDTVSGICRKYGWDTKQ